MTLILGTSDERKTDILLAGQPAPARGGALPRRGPQHAGGGQHPRQLVQPGRGRPARLQGRPHAALPPGGARPMGQGAARELAHPLARPRSEKGRPAMKDEFVIEALRAQLERDAERITVALLGEPTAKGRHEWRWGNRGSLAYDFDRHLWHSFETEAGGDIFELIRFANSGWDFSHVLAWARSWVGIRTSDPDIRPRPRERRFKAESEQLALRLWHEARPATGTPLETYLASRGLKLPYASEHALRFHPA